jgi:hypothetical protein
VVVHVQCRFTAAETGDGLAGWVSSPYEGRYLGDGRHTISDPAAVSLTDRCGFDSVNLHWNY